MQCNAEPVLWSPQATTTEDQVRGVCALQQEKPLQREARTPLWRVAAARHTWRKPACSIKDLAQPKIDKI